MTHNITMQLASKPPLLLNHFTHQSMENGESPVAESGPSTDRRSATVQLGCCQCSLCRLAMNPAEQLAAAMGVSGSMGIAVIGRVMQALEAA